jgi:hypothetical protein
LLSVSALNRVDLPTLGNPTMPIDKLIGFYSNRGNRREIVFCKNFGIIRT